MSDTSSSGTPPPREASGAPAIQSDIGWTTVQQLHELTGDVGRLTEAVNTLKETVKDQTGKLDRVQTRITLATGFIVGFGLLLTVLVGLVGWLLNNGLTLLTKWLEITAGG